MTDQEVHGLKRVLERLASTQDEKLETVLEKLLPICIGKLDSTRPEVLQHVLAILSHVNKRLQALPHVQLPLPQLLELYSNTNTAMVHNFSLVYIERGMDGASPATRLHQVPLLLKACTLQNSSFQQRTTLLRLAVLGLQTLASTASQTTLDSFKASIQASKLEMEGFLDFARRFMLYTPPSFKSSAGESRVLKPPPGLSIADVEAIQGKSGPLPNDILQQQKLGILNFTELLEIPPSDVFGLYVIAASDPSDSVCQRGEDLLKTRCPLDSKLTVIDLESDSLISELMTLFLGESNSNEFTPPTPALRSRLLSLFCKSVKAANTLPGALMVISESVFNHPKTSPKLQRQGMEFSVWMVQHVQETSCLAIAPTILQSCLSLLRETSQDLHGYSQSSVRAFSYQTIGQLARRVPTAFTGRMDIVKQCFEGLISEPAGIRDTVAEATHALADVFKDGMSSKEDQAQVLAFLKPIMSTMRESDAARAAALHWITTVSPADDAGAWYAGIMATADPNSHISRSAAIAIGVVDSDTYDYESAASPSSVSSLPSLPDMLQYIMAANPTLSLITPPDHQTLPLALPPPAWLSAIKVLEKCRTATRTTNSLATVNATDAASYLTFLEHALVRSAPSDLHKAALSTMLLLHADNAYRSHVEGHLVSRTAPMERLLGSTDTEVRELSGRLLGIAAAHAMNDDQARALINRIFVLNASLYEFSAEESCRPLKKRRFEELDGSLRAVGFVLAGWYRRCPGETDRITLKAMTDTLVRFVVSPPQPTADRLRAVAVRALGYASLCSPSLRLRLRSLTTPPYDLVTAVFKDLLVFPKGSGNKIGRSVDEDSLAEDDNGVTTLGPKWMEQVTSPALQGLALLALETESESETETESESFASLLIQRLLSDDAKNCIHQPTVLAIGEVLCFVFGVDSGFTCVETLLYTAKTSGEGLLNVNNIIRADPLASPPVDSNSGSDSILHKEDEKLKILDAVMDMASHSRKEVRSSGTTWLVSILLFCRESVLRLISNARHRTELLPRIQRALVTAAILEDGEAIQIVAARGLAALYYDFCQDTSTDDLFQKEKMLSELVTLLSGSASHKRKKETAEAKEKGSIPSELIAHNSPQLLVYKELCSLATDLGAPRLVVAFLQVAQDQGRCSEGGFFGTASVMRAAIVELTAHLPAIIPRLYRLLYDPLPRVRDAMQRVWVALVDEPRAAIRANFGPIMTALCTDMTGATWRGRESAALAAADCLQQRQWDEVAPFFSGLWVATFRVMDDVKESVRTAGLALVRALRGFTLRVASAASTASTASEGEGEALKAALPFLLTQGLGSTVPEVKAVSLDTISRCISLAARSSIKPLLPSIVPHLLEALSGLEDTRLNYVEQHAQRWGIDPAGLDVARTAASKEGPLAESLDLCAKCVDDLKTFEELALQLVSIVRRGVGVATKCGTGRFVSKAVGQVLLLQQMPYLSTATDMKTLSSNAENHKERPQKSVVLLLLKAIQETIFQEKSGSVRSSYATAFASLLRLVPLKKAETILIRLLETITDGIDDSGQPGGSSSNEPSNEKVCGTLFLAVAAECKELFARLSNDIAPVAFVLSQESSERQASGSVWDRIGEECCTSVRLHVPAILRLASSWLRSSRWDKKNRGAGAIVAVTTSPAADALCLDENAFIMETLFSVASGRLWEGGETALRAAGTLVRACISHGGKGEILVNARKLTELLVNVAGSRKKKVVYRQEALKQLTEILAELNKQGRSGMRDDEMLLWDSPCKQIGDMLLEMCRFIVLHRSSTTAASASTSTSTTLTTTTTATAGATDSSKDHDVLFVPVVQVVQAFFSSCRLQTYTLVQQNNNGEASIDQGRELLFVEPFGKLLPLSHKPSEQAAVMDAALAIVECVSKSLSVVKKEQETFEQISNELASLGTCALRIVSEGKGLLLREKAVGLLSAIIHTLRAGAIQDECLEEWRLKVLALKSEEKVPSMIAALETLV